MVKPFLDAARAERLLQATRTPDHTNRLTLSASMANPLSSPPQTLTARKFLHVEKAKNFT